MAEKYLGWSPYNYCGSNPLNHIDFDGKGYGIPSAAPIEFGAFAAGVTLGIGSFILIKAAHAFFTQKSVSVAVSKAVETSKNYVEKIVTKLLNEGKEGDGENTNPYKGPVTEPVTVVDPSGNATQLNPGESMGSSKDGEAQQVKGKDGKPTGTRKDKGHSPAKHKDPRAQVPHAHVPGVTNPDGTPWLPLK
jgi:hypothetical protein